MSAVAAEGKPLFVEAHGNGPDLVLLHGWAMHGGIFTPLVERLAPLFRVHVVDLPGHGGSRGEARFVLGATARRLALQLPRAIWAGWSLGGLVALDVALAHPQRVRGVAMIASSPRFVRAPDWPHGVEARVFEEFAAALGSRYHATIERFLALETLGSAHAQEQLRELRRRVFERGEPDPAALADGLAVLEGADFRDRLAALAMPSLWLGGRRDRLVPPAALAWAAQQAPGGRHLAVDSGHAPFLEHADAVTEALAGLAAELAA
jgi:pimeloyl-[acyl-carrier protein] methyl ester esterase